MPGNYYHFVTPWHINAPVEDIWPLISDATTFSRWWPKVFLEITPLDDDPGPGKAGRRLDFHTKGWLPYHLRWTGRVTEVDPPRRLVIQAAGDFNGRAIWNLAPEASGTLVMLDWEISADMPFLRYFSPVFRPLFEWNHRWSMAQGEEGLRAELQRTGKLNA